jgi:capsular polysaccharide biosynthesis protein
VRQSETDSDLHFDALSFARYARGQWLVFTISCGAAVVLATLISLALPKRYTATASILIEPPAGNDPRAATAVSPVYLESLKTYERIASSNTMFQEALKRLGIPEAGSGASVESLKRTILKVAKPTSTKILEISTTLADPEKAQALAQYLAEKTVQLSKDVDSDSEREVTRESRRILAAAEARQKRAEEARETAIKTEPIANLDDEVTNGAELRFRVRRDLASASSELAEAVAAQQSAPKPPSESSITSLNAIQTAKARARVTQLQNEVKELSQAIETKGLVLEQRKLHRDALETELKAARAAYEAAHQRLNDVLVSSGFRSERLNVIDRGVIPKSPSSPNLPLNIVAALLLSLVASTVYVAVQFARVPDRLYSPQAVRAYR